MLWLFRPSLPNPVQVRHRLYRERLDLTGKPLVLLSGASLEAAREVIPFLAGPNDLGTATVDLTEVLAYNGEQADEIHAFTNVKQGREKLSRILMRDGRIIELTIKG